MATRHKLGSIVVILLVTLSLAVLLGCGGGTTTTTAGGGATTTAAPGTTATTAAGSSTTSAPSGGDIPIGFLSSFSGEMAIAGPVWVGAANMAVTDINAAGGVNGGQLKLVQEDDKSLPEEAVKGAQKLISVNHVISINGSLSDSLLAVYPISKEAGVMATSPGAGSTRLDQYKGDWVYRTCPPDSEWGAAMAQVILDGGYKNVAMMYENTESNQSQAKSSKTVLEAAGVTIAAEVAFEPGQSTYSAELKKIADTNPECVYLSVGATSATTLLKEASQKGYKWQWVATNEIMDQSVMASTGQDALEGILSVTMSAGTDSPSYASWAARYKQVTGQDVQGLYEANSYDAIIIQALAMTKAGAATGAAINANYSDVSSPPGDTVLTYADGVAALKAGKDINYEGVSGPCDFDAIGATPGSYVEMKAENGQWVEVKTFKVNQ
jgi:branched-chain amino acid transport system substrate-binding protein